MKFGKYIQAHQIPGWSEYYLEYKVLKKIISSLSGHRPASEAAALALGTRRTPADILNESNAISSVLGMDGPPILAGTGEDGNRGLDFQAHKAAFFFKLERELEKINGFYLRKEAELKLRLETLLSKRRAAAMRAGSGADTDMTHAEWSAAEEGFRLLERDLGKLQQFVEINATGFRKILKKFDKRSTSTTKELYLARQVEVQPMFNKQLISDLADTVAACLVDLTDLSTGLRFEGPSSEDIFTQQINSERQFHTGPFHDLEQNLRKAVSSGDSPAITECVRVSEVLSRQPQPNGAKNVIPRILWNVILEAPQSFADLILASLSSPFDFQYVDDISGRTFLHDAAIAGELRLVEVCIEQNVQIDRADAYGRTALHYTALHGHALISSRLLEHNAPSSSVDMDSSSPLMYAILKGHVDCVRILLDEGHIDLLSATPPGRIPPLSLASQAGHENVVSLLLQYGATSVPDANGMYPIHFAAQKGHHQVCKLLLKLQGWDLPDKYYEWTPLFHASRNGHRQCVKLLLEGGSLPNRVDELGHIPVHYAAWYGFDGCLDLLLAVFQPGLPSTGSISSQLVESSPASDDSFSRETESDIDLIPPISLPPPIMPYRVYGHNYLDKNYLVQVSIGERYRRRQVPAVRLYHHLISSTFKDEYFLASTPLKLVTTTGTGANSAPYTISLPQNDDSPGYFTFQIANLDNLTLEFSLYPHFGTKTIGRAVALPSLFLQDRSRKSYVLPILDTRLHVIGEVLFEVNIICPFENVTLEVAGGVETYWKVMRNTSGAASYPWQNRANVVGSTQTSPSAHSVTSAVERGLTITSLAGQFVHITVQVTRDLHPVVFCDSCITESEFTLGVHDMTLAQFEALSRRRGLDMDNNLTDLPSKLNSVMVSLSRVLEHLPPMIPLFITLRRPSEETGLHLSADNDQFVNCILRTTQQSWNGRRARKLVFGSTSADVCSALNWKQPNYPVFFQTSNQENSGVADERSSSLAAAVDFAQRNNLMGVFIDEALLARVPSLIQGIRNLGLLAGALAGSPYKLERNKADVYCESQYVTFVEHSHMSADKI